MTVDRFVVEHLTAIDQQLTDSSESETEVESEAPREEHTMAESTLERAMAQMLIFSKEQAEIARKQTEETEKQLLAVRKQSEETEKKLVTIIEAMWKDVTPGKKQRGNEMNK